MVVCRVKSYAEEFVPIIDEKGEIHKKYNREWCAITYYSKELHYNIYEESLFKEKVFEIVIMLCWV